MSRQDKRATGRTTRMLKAAIETARGGNYVYVIAANQNHADLLKRTCADMCDGKAMRARVYPASGGEVMFVPADGGSWSWETRSVLGLGVLPSFGVFIDHFAVESHYGAVFDMWEQFDELKSQAELGR